MPTNDHAIVVRVARRYEARLRAERRAREVQRRKDGLVEADEGEDDVGEDRGVGDAVHAVDVRGAPSSTAASRRGAARSFSIHAFSSSIEANRA